MYYALLRVTVLDYKALQILLPKYRFLIIGLRFPKTSCWQLCFRSFRLVCSHDIYRRLYTGTGRPCGGFPDLRYLYPYRAQAPYKLLELKAVISALHHWVTVHQGHQIMIATDNTTVVSYISKQGGTHSPSLLHLVVDLFMWLQAQNIILRAGHIPGCLTAYLDPVSQ